MNFKITFILSVIILFTCTKTFAQDTVTVYSNNKKVVSFISTETSTDKTIHLKKCCTKKTKAIFVKVKGTHTAQSMYRPSLEVTDAAEKNNSTLELISANDANFNITAVAKTYNVFKGASLKLYLVLNPANSKMMVRSQRIFLATLTNK